MRMATATVEQIGEFLHVEPVVALPVEADDAVAAQQRVLGCVAQGLAQTEEGLAQVDLGLFLGTFGPEEWARCSRWNWSPGWVIR